jgi:hypothetical protein
LIDGLASHTEPGFGQVALLGRLQLVLPCDLVRLALGGCRLERLLLVGYGPLTLGRFRRSGTFGVV